MTEDKVQTRGFLALSLLVSFTTCCTNIKSCTVSINNCGSELIPPLTMLVSQFISGKLKSPNTSLWVMYGIESIVEVGIAVSLCWL